MPCKLYVSNLSQAATLNGMRELFGTCGDVLDVEFAAERGSRSPRSAAYVTMATSRAADRAVHDLHGRLHGDRVLMISRLPGHDAPAPDAGRAARRAVTEVPVAVTQQYRDRRGLTYELTCSGKLLTLRFIFPVDDADDWQVEARLLPGPPSAVTAGAVTRERAFRALIEAWGSSGNQLADSELDWEAVGAVLRAVKAL
jgi:hypothetical protein